jgi:hypothetical protein
VTDEAGRIKGALYMSRHAAKFCPIELSPKHSSILTAIPTDFGTEEAIEVSGK